MTLLPDPVPGTPLSGRPRRPIVPIALAALVSVGAGLAGGVVLGRHSASPAPPTLLQPAADQQTGLDGTLAASRAVALVVGSTRAGDGMTFDQWYRARMNRLATGIRLRYVALFNGNAACGYWAVSAVVPSGPILPTDPRNEVDILNHYGGGIAAVDARSGAIVGLNPAATGISLSEVGGDNCVRPAMANALDTSPSKPAWYSEFLTGAAP